MYEVGSLSNFIDTKKKKSEVKLESSLKTIFSDDTKSKFDRLLRPEEFQIKARIKKNETEADESSKKKRKYDDMAIEKKITPAPPDIDDRTLFVGNIPKTETSNTVRKLFEQFGEIISIRLRSLPIAGTAVDDAGNQTLVKKICANKNKLGEQKGSFNAYGELCCCVRSYQSISSKSFSVNSLTYSNETVVMF
jgi:nucleolar protein 12